MPWSTFLATFKHSVDNAPIATVHKMSYLLSCLQGPAAQAVSGYALEEHNYNGIKDTLFRRFGDSVAPRRKLHNELQSLKPTNRSSFCTTPNDRNPSYTQSISSPNQSSFAAVHSNSNQHRQKANNYTSKKKKEPSAYPFCNGRHCGAQCEQFHTVESRRNRAKQHSGKKLCLRCLKKDHFSKDCANKRLCYYCRSSGHHQALCNNAQPRQIVSMGHQRSTGSSQAI
ncbi:unnamed protein product [Anisakis simplex]|uniref:CCHC-type domain-containing protein n=1 Tax=Anisakis simplex TaxID=6269 RepID=A0A3P6S2E2_ANISI|nr:unnamed protein product [Anisakis simplex]